MCVLYQGSHFCTHTERLQMPLRHKDKTKCLKMSFKHRKLMPLQRKKMHLLPLVFSTIIFLSHFSLLPYVSCSPMPGRQQGVYQHQGEPKEKCPELTYCDCVERNNKQRKLDITCNGVTSAQLKVNSRLYFSIKLG